MFRYILLTLVAAVIFQNGSGDSDGCNGGDKYDETLDLILRSEGNCQNWASDSGNRYKGRTGHTCMGITPERGYQNRQSFYGCGGFSGHPATFVKWCYDRSPANFKAGAKQIYRQIYIQNVCDHLNQPAFYVCTDISVNSGPGRAKQFLGELSTEGITARTYAKWLNARHRLFYIRLNKPQFIRGWLNRAAARDRFIDNC